MQIEITKTEASKILSLLEKDIINNEFPDHRKASFELYVSINAVLMLPDMNRYCQNGIFFYLTKQEHAQINELLKPTEETNAYTRRPNKISAIKLLRELSGRNSIMLGLKDAKNACENSTIFPNAADGEYHNG